MKKGSIVDIIGTHVRGMHSNNLYRVLGVCRAGVIVEGKSGKSVLHPQLHCVKENGSDMPDLNHPIFEGASGGALCLSNIYVASSWRNPVQGDIVSVLRRCGHEVYDFKNPAPGNHGFSWAEIDPNWQNWTVAQYAQALKFPVAEAGHAHDMNALDRAEVCVLVMPSGRSAAWELGYAMGKGKRSYVIALEPMEPELMFRGCTFIDSREKLIEEFNVMGLYEGEKT